MKKRLLTLTDLLSQKNNPMKKRLLEKGLINLSGVYKPRQKTFPKLEKKKESYQQLKTLNSTKSFLRTEKLKKVEVLSDIRKKFFLVKNNEKKNKKFKNDRSEKVLQLISSSRKKGRKRREIGLKKLKNNLHKKTKNVRVFANMKLINDLEFIKNGKLATFFLKKKNKFSSEKKFPNRYYRKKDFTVSYNRAKKHLMTNKIHSFSLDQKKLEKSKSEEVRRSLNIRKKNLSILKRKKEVRVFCDKIMMEKSYLRNLTRKVKNFKHRNQELKKSLNSLKKDKKVSAMELKGVTFKEFSKIRFDEKLTKTVEEKNENSEDIREPINSIQRKYRLKYSDKKQNKRGNKNFFSSKKFKKKNGKKFKSFNIGEELKSATFDGWDNCYQKIEDVHRLAKNVKEIDEASIDFVEYAAS